MNTAIAIITVLIGAYIIGRLLQNKKIQIKQRSKSFKEIVKDTFPKYVIREKYNQIMICEYNHRNEPDELVFIRIGNSKSIKKSGRMIIADYPRQPTAQEMKKDFGRYL